MLITVNSLLGLGCVSALISRDLLGAAAVFLAALMVNAGRLL